VLTNLFLLRVLMGTRKIYNKYLWNNTFHSLLLWQQPNGTLLLSDGRWGEARTRNIIEKQTFNLRFHTK